MIRRCPGCQTKNRIPEKRLDGAAHCAKCKAPLVPLSQPIAIASQSEFETLLRDSPLPVLVDFWADWCAPCRAIAPELEQLARQRAGDVVVAKVDTEALPSVAGSFRIRGIPTLVLFREGTERSRVSGAMPAAEIQRRLGLG